MLGLLSAALFLADPQAAEWLAMPMPHGFETAHHQVASMGEIEERIAKGESVDEWTRMVTILRMNADLTPEAYLSNYLPRVIGDCKGGKYSEPAKAMVSGQPALRGRVDCPLNPSTGKPETFFYRILNRDGALLMVQVAFRRVPSTGDTRWAEARLTEAVLCDAESKLALCRR